MDRPAVLTELCELARKYGTDKGGQHNKLGPVCHNYTPAYDKLLNKRRQDVAAVLEIGIGYPENDWGGSLRMWAEYFPRAEIIGLDINPDVMLNEGRIHSVIADQGSAESLLAAVGEARFDLIVDDGSHQWDHIFTSMATLLPRLATKGLYAIEDIPHLCQSSKVFRRLPSGFRGTAIPCPPAAPCYYIPGPVTCSCCRRWEELLVIDHQWT